MLRSHFSNTLFDFETKNKRLKMSKRLQAGYGSAFEEMVVRKKEMKKMYEKPPYEKPPYEKLPYEKLPCEPPTSSPEHQDRDAMYCAEIERLRALLTEVHKETETSHYTQLKKEKQKYDKLIQAKEREIYSLKCDIQDLQKRLEGAQQTINADRGFLKKEQQDYDDLKEYTEQAKENHDLNQHLSKEDQSSKCEPSTTKANYLKEEVSRDELRRVRQLADEFQKENRKLQEEQQNLLSNYNKQIEENEALISIYNYYCTENRNLEQKLGLMACVVNKRPSRCSRCEPSTSKANYHKEVTFHDELRRVQQLADDLQEENRKLQEEQQNLLSNYIKQVEENEALIYKHNYYIRVNQDLEQQLEQMKACVADAEKHLSKEVKKVDQGCQCEGDIIDDNQIKELQEQIKKEQEKKQKESASEIQRVKVSTNKTEDGLNHSLQEELNKLRSEANSAETLMVKMEELKKRLKGQEAAYKLLRERQQKSRKALKKTNTSETLLQDRELGGQQSTAL